MHAYTRAYISIHHIIYIHANECAANTHAEILIVALSAPNTIGVKKKRELTYNNLLRYEIFNIKSIVIQREQR